MTSQECECRDQRTIDSIRCVLNAHEQLRSYAASLQVTIEDTVIMLRGEVPSNDLKAELIPAVRTAGVLSKVCNQVRVATPESLIR